MYQKQYESRLGINPPSRWQNRQQRQFRWLPLKDENGSSYPWAIDGKLDPVFHDWLAQRWMEKFNCIDIFEAKADVLSYMINNPERLEVKWVEYQGFMHAKFHNANTRLKNGLPIPQQEQDELKRHIGALTRSLPETSALSMTAPERVDLPPQLQPSQSIEQEAKQVDFLQELSRVAKPMPKVKEPTPRNEIEEINVWLADPILRKEVPSSTLAKFECVLNEYGEPIQAIAYKDADEIQGLEKLENVD